MTDSVLNVMAVENGAGQPGLNLMTKEAVASGSHPAMIMVRDGLFYQECHPACHHRQFISKAKKVSHIVTCQNYGRSGHTCQLKREECGMDLLRNNPILTKEEVCAKIRTNFRASEEKTKQMQADANAVVKAVMMSMMW